MLGLGYPGGAALERLALGGDPEAFPFPGSRRVSGGGAAGLPGRFAEGLDFSFAGVKTALLYKLRELPEQERSERAPDLAASYQARDRREPGHRVPSRALAAHRAAGAWRSGAGSPPTASCAGGCGELGVDLHVPDRALCTDNAAMIASAARYGERLAYPHYLAARRLRQRRASSSVPPCPS